MYNTVNLRSLARDQNQLATRPQLLALGMSAPTICRKVKRGEWSSPHKGVILLHPGPMTYHQEVRAACMAAGPGGKASFRCGWLVWKLDGVKSAPVEITIAYGKRTHLQGVITHRTRHWSPEEFACVDGIPVMCIERVLAEGGRWLTERIVEYGVECAIRRNLTTPARLRTYLNNGGILLPGGKVLERLLDLRPEGGPAGSPAEVDFLRFLRAKGLPMPIRQYRLRLANGRVIVIDFAWPELRFGIEWQGREFHTGRSDEAQDFDRRQAAEEIGWTLELLGGNLLNERQPAIARMIERRLHLA